MSKHRPVIVCVITMHQQQTVIGSKVVTQSIEQSISSFTKCSLARPPETSQPVTVIQAYVIKVVAEQIVFGRITQSRVLGRIEEIVNAS